MVKKHLYKVEIGMNGSKKMNRFDFHVRYNVMLFLENNIYRFFERRNDVFLVEQTFFNVSVPSSVANVPCRI